MKAGLNLTTDEELLNRVKLYAGRRQSSVSQLVEEYFTSIVKKPKKQSVIELIEFLPKPDIDTNLGLKEVHYEENRKKYGF